MLTEVTELYGMSVYTDKGVLLGQVNDVIFEMEQQDIYGIYIAQPNPQVVENGSAISVPFRWVKSIGEIILLRKFPAFLKVPQE
ncbi:MAG: PRC-barrel domain-containing protein [Candidatus Thermoplasmatota archaeon]|jgi:sporulation protein YlmC with PRC-barrel domain|nr:PRC-barrel domain-containing protein [Candidatus Thermoplasmatota archaeon]MCL5955010.1 PRC-barrel domain-containing protein [Candidatus Thermoplasmatota archaeon]